MPAKKKAPKKKAATKTKTVMTKKRHKRKVHHVAPKRKHSRRRRTMSAGAGAFKMLSNPFVGGIVGGAAGIIVKNMVKKAMPGNDMIATAAPVVIGFLLRKKAPMVAAGMVAVPALAWIGTKVPMLAEGNLYLAEGGNTTFSEPLLLADEMPPILLNEQGYTLNEDEYSY
jgi:hypothetical protein